MITSWWSIDDWSEIRSDSQKKFGDCLAIDRWLFGDLSTHIP